MEINISLRSFAFIFVLKPLKKQLDSSVSSEAFRFRIVDLLRPVKWTQSHFCNRSFREKEKTVINRFFAEQRLSELCLHLSLFLNDAKTIMIKQVSSDAAADARRTSWSLGSADLAGETSRSSPNAIKLYGFFHQFNLDQNCWERIQSLCFTQTLFQAYNTTILLVELMRPLTRPRWNCWMFCIFCTFYREVCRIMWNGFK